MRHWLDQVEQLWCHAMHGGVMWPVHGEYRCRACLRAYPVPFAAAERRPVQGQPIRRVSLCEN